MTVTVPTALRTMDSVLGTFTMARRIPALGPVIDALRRSEAGGSAVSELPIVSPDKLQC